MNPCILILRSMSKHMPAIAMSLQEGGGKLYAELCHNTRHGYCQATRLAVVQKKRKFHFFLISPNLVSTLSRNVIDFEGVERLDSCGEFGIDNVGNHNSAGFLHKTPQSVHSLH